MDKDKFYDEFEELDEEFWKIADELLTEWFSKQELKDDIDWDLIGDEEDPY